MLITQLQNEIATSGLSSYRIARLAEVDIAQLSRFRHQGAGLSLASASRVAGVLGLKLTPADDGDTEPQ